MASSKQTTEIEIRPGIGTLEMFRYMDYKPWYAIGEFVDNSIASWQQHRRALQKADGKDFVLEIRIELDQSDSGELRIWDNAAGISTKDYARAFRPADRPPDQSHLARYGMGMKTAACWFSDKWSVTTTALGEDVERTLRFDIPRIVKSGIERLEPTMKRADPNDHWTELVLRDLNSVPVKRTVGKIKDYLGQMYRRFLASGEVAIYWNNDPVKYQERSVLIAPHHSETNGSKKHRWEKEFELSLPKGEKVRGRSLLFERGEQAAAGLHLFWRQRLIKGSLESKYSPPEIFGQGNTFRQQRLLVELDLDAFSPTVDKTDFVWGNKNSTEAELLQALKRELDRAPLKMLDQAENFRANKPDKDTKKAAKVAAEKTAQAISDRAGEEITDQVNRTPPKDDSLPLPIAAPLVGESTLDLVVGGAKWRIAIELSDDGVHRSRLLEISEKPSVQSNGTRRLGIRVALHNPFVVQFASDDRSVAVLLRLLAALALAEVTARSAGVKSAGEIRRNFNDLVTNVLAEP